MRGDHTAARAEFERILRNSPEFARAHYSLGVLEAGEGRHAEAVKYLAAAVRHQPDYTEARLRWAASLRAMQRPGESLDQFERVLAINPANVEARMGQALALVQLGRYPDARDRLSDAVNAYPQEWAFTHALARLLAAAPDDRVRNGPQALRFLQHVLRNQPPTPDLGETMAMALAELGRYGEAVAIQKGPHRRRRKGRSAGRRAAPEGQPAALRARRTVPHRGVKRNCGETQELRN